MNKIVNGVANDYEFPDLDWVHHDSKTINENYYKVINGTALYYENYVQQLQQKIDQLTNNWNELEEYIEKESSKYISTNPYIDGTNATYEEILDKMKEIKEREND